MKKLTFLLTFLLTMSILYSQSSADKQQEGVKNPLRGGITMVDSESSSDTIVNLPIYIPSKDCDHVDNIFYKKDMFYDKGYKNKCILWSPTHKSLSCATITIDKEGFVLEITWLTSKGWLSYSDFYLHESYIGNKYHLYYSPNEDPFVVYKLTNNEYEQAYKGAVAKFNKTNKK